MTDSYMSREETAGVIIGDSILSMMVVVKKVQHIVTSAQDMWVTSSFSLYQLSSNQSYT